MQETELLQKTNLAGEIAHHIRKKIIRGQYESDHHLNEVSLAEELKVSRGPIREALSHLEMEGFVYSQRNGRTHVRTFSKSSFADYQRIRFHLEYEACYKIIETTRDQAYTQWIKEMHSIIDEMARAEQSNDDATENNMDYLFHDKLIERADSIIYMGMWKSLSGIRRSIMETNRSFYIRKNISGEQLSNVHRNILISLEKADKEAVRLALHAHFSTGLSSFLTYHNTPEKEA